MNATVKPCALDSETELASMCVGEGAGSKANPPPPSSTGRVKIRIRHAQTHRRPVLLRLTAALASIAAQARHNFGFPSNPPQKT